VRELGPVEWAAVEAVTNGLAAAERRVAQAQAELTAVRQRRAAVFDALRLDAGTRHHFEPDGVGGASVHLAGGGGSDGATT
jgi:hypothetical protein